jgi:hypothetical protein
MRLMMRLILMALILTLPYLSHAQGQSQKFRIKIGLIELPTDSVPDFVDLPERVDRFQIKKEKNNNNEPTATYTVQIGEEEQTFLTDGNYHEVIFTHNIKGLVIYILDEKRNPAGKHFILRRRR